MAFVSTTLDDNRIVSDSDPTVFITRNGSLNAVFINRLSGLVTVSINNHGIIRTAIVDQEGTKNVNIINTGSITARSNAIIDNVNTGTYNIFNSGLITSNLANIYRSSGDTNINNTGDIAGTSLGSHAIYLGRGANSIVNSGTISCAGGNAALELGALGTSVNRIDNTGDILGGTGPSARAIQCYGGADVVLNAGSIVGRILLGGGGDVYDGAVGRIVGIVFGEIGADTLTGGAGRERLDGGAGTDLLRGGEGEDTLLGGADGDILEGDDGRDMLYGGAGADVLDGGDSFDWARYDEASHGAMTIHATRPHLSTGAAAGDVFIDIEGIRGGAGAERIYAGGTVRDLIGGAGRDALFGSHGADRLNGGADADTLTGGAGADTLIGGAGSDLFRFTVAPSTGVDVIEDFSAGERIALSTVVFSSIGPTIVAAEFFVGAAAKTAAHRVIYDPTTGELLYDRDGSRTGAAMVFAELDPSLALTAANFVMI